MPFSIFQEALMRVCLVGLILTSAALFLASIWPFVRSAWDVIGCRSAKAMFLLASSGACLFGGAKHVIGTITYPRTYPDAWYLQDNGSEVSNDFIRIDFNRNIIVPSTANFFIDGLALEYTNATDWATHSFNAYSNTFDRMTLPIDVPFPAATNYNWIAYTDWTPPPVVHTNGVAYVVWQIGVGKLTNDLAMTRTGVYCDGRRLAPSQAVTNGPSSVVTSTNLNLGETENE